MTNTSLPPTIRMECTDCHARAFAPRTGTEPKGAEVYMSHCGCLIRKGMTTEGLPYYVDALGNRIKA